MYKAPPVHGTTCVSTQQYQFLLIDFSFSGMTSDDSDQRTIYDVINGKTSWILITEHFTIMKHVDARMFKASPIAWIRHFLNQYSPNFHDKYIHLDQGGELFNNRYLDHLPQSFGYTLYPTGDDTYHQNGPVKSQ